MNTSTSKADSQKLVGKVQMARRWVATAESRWKAAKEQARAAKRRRKEVKLIARRARKQAKRAKADLAGFRKILARAEAKLAESVARLATRKHRKVEVRSVAKAIAAARRRRATSSRPRRKEIRPVVRRATKQANAKLARSGPRLATKKPVRVKSRLVAKAIAVARIRKSAPARRRQTVPSAPSPVPGFAVPVTPAPLEDSVLSSVPAQANPATSVLKTTEPSTTNTQNDQS